MPGLAGLSLLEEIARIMTPAKVTKLYERPGMKAPPLLVEIERPAPKKHAGQSLQSRHGAKAQPYR